MNTDLMATKNTSLRQDYGWQARNAKADGDFSLRFLRLLWLSLFPL
jgi:hypothetical protein